MWKWVTSLLLGMPRRRLVHDPCAYQRPSEHTGVVDRYLTMYHALGFVQIRQMGVIYAIFQRGVYVFHACCRCYIDDTSMVLTALGQTKHKVASDIVWTMDLGVGMDWNGVLPIMRRLEPHMCHFCGILSVMPRRCNISKWKATPEIRRRRSIK